MNILFWILLGLAEPPSDIDCDPATDSNCQSVHILGGSNGDRPPEEGEESSTGN